MTRAHTRPAAAAPVRVEAAPIRRVRISDATTPGDYLYLRLRWRCPVETCRLPRGEPRREVHAHFDAAGREIARTVPDVWDRHPRCPHVRLAHELIAEAAALAAEVPRPRTHLDSR